MLSLEYSMVCETHGNSCGIFLFSSSRLLRRPAAVHPRSDHANHPVSGPGPGAAFLRAFAADAAVNGRRGVGGRG